MPYDLLVHSMSKVVIPRKSPIKVIIRCIKINRFAKTHFEPTTSSNTISSLSSNLMLRLRKKIIYEGKITHLLTDELSLGAFISIKWFLIITSFPAQAAAALTSSSERPYSQNQIINWWWTNNSRCKPLEQNKFNFYTRENQTQTSK